MSDRNYLFTSESVTEGHPDKMCDAISDAVLDAIITREAELAESGFPGASPDYVRGGIESFTTTGQIIVGGEIRTHAYVDIHSIVRGVVNEIGYNRAKYGFDAETCGVLVAVHEQSPDIAQGVDESFEVQHGKGDDPIDLIGAGDQGMMFGYACTETSTLMPMPIYLAHRLAERLTAVRRAEVLDYLRPDGKTQVTVRYEKDKPVAVEKILISTQHADGVSIEDLLRPDLIEHVIKPVFDLEGLDYPVPRSTSTRRAASSSVAPWATPGSPGARSSSTPTVAWAATVAARSRARTARRSTALQPTPLAGSPRTSSPQGWRTAARSSLPTRSASPTRCRCSSRRSAPRRSTRPRSRRQSSRPSTCVRVRSSATSTCGDRSTARPRPTVTSVAKTATSRGSAPTESRSLPRPPV